MKNGAELAARMCWSLPSYGTDPKRNAANERKNTHATEKHTLNGSTKESIRWVGGQRLYNSDRDTRNRDNALLRLMMEG